MGSEINSARLSHQLSVKEKMVKNAASKNDSKSDVEINPALEHYEKSRRETITMPIMAKTESVPSKDEKQNLQKT